jgi:hypothetical protein
MENGIEVPLKIKKRIIYDPGILLFGIYPKQLKIGLGSGDSCL